MAGSGGARARPCPSPRPTHTARAHTQAGPRPASIPEPPPSPEDPGPADARARRGGEGDPGGTRREAWKARFPEKRLDLKLGSRSHCFHRSHGVRSGPRTGLRKPAWPRLWTFPLEPRTPLSPPAGLQAVIPTPPRRPPHKPPPLGLMEPWSVAHGLPPTQLYPMLSPTPCLTLAADSPGGLPPSPGQQDRWDRPAEDALAVAGVSEPGDCPPRHTRPLTATTLKDALGCSGEQCPCMRTRGCHTSPSRAPQRHGEPGPPPHVLTRAPALPGHRGPPQKPQSFAERPGHVRIVWPLLSHFCLPTSGVLRTAPTASVL